MIARVLIVAGSDSGGGAGIQADIKTVTALGGYAMTAIAALTAQNTEGVAAIHDVPADFVALQMRLALSDIGADAIKTGMLSTAAVVDAVAAALKAEAAAVPLVVDPVMMAKGGHALLADDAIAAVRERLIPLARIVTPNVPEAETLTGMAVRTEADMIEAGSRILALGAAAVLVKGGHLDGAEIVDVLVERGRPPQSFKGTRIDTRHTHGTGCTLASAIATGIAQGLDLPSVVRRARAYVREAIATAPGLGRGHGPLNHGHTVKPFTG